MLTQERLKELLAYDPGTGHFTWLVARKGWRGIKPGQRAGKVRAGYIDIGIDGRRYGAHRLAWLYVFGVWPKHEIDHKNAVRNDNRISNLREASTNQNRFNSLRANKYGFKGITLHKPSGLWQSRIRAFDKVHSLGYFKTPEEAHAAYCDAAKKHHGEFARMG